jgi:hypothetical protein
MQADTTSLTSTLTTITATEFSRFKPQTISLTVSEPPSGVLTRPPQAHLRVFRTAPSIKLLLINCCLSLWNRRTPDVFAPRWALEVDTGMVVEMGMDADMDAEGDGC